MELVIPNQAMDFEFNSARSSPFLSVPSTPKRFGEFYYSAPTSPTHISQFYRDFDDFSLIANMNIIETEMDETNFEDEFAFDVGNESEKTSLSADELFDDGKIRPFKPPPQSLLGKRADESETRNSPLRSPISQGKKILKSAFSPRQKKEFNPFTEVGITHERSEHERGRERVYSLSSSSSSRRGTRSLSPYRVSAYPWEEEEKQMQQNTKQTTITKPSLPSSDSNLSLSSSKGYRKWKLKDLFLFRSASEGRASDRDPLKKYSALFRKHEDLKNSSFRSVEGSNSGSSSSKRRGPISAHELHYTVNRAVSEDLKKKTFLPYKQGILGRLAFNPTVHALTNGFGFSRK